MPRSPALQNYVEQVVAQKKFKEMSGKRMPAFETMQQTRKMIEQCDRLQYVINYARFRVKRGYTTLRERELFTWGVPFYSLIREDLKSWGFFLTERTSVPCLDLIALEQKIGARKGAFRKKDLHYRNLSTKYIRWCAGRDPLGCSIKAPPLFVEPSKTGTVYRIV